MLSAFPDPIALLPGGLAFLRIGAILLALPLIGDPPTPMRVRVLLALSLAIGLSSLIPKIALPSLETDVLSVALIVCREVVIGMVIGYLARMCFDGILMAASIVAYQMGFGTSSLFVPDAGAQMDAFSAFHRVVVMLIFLALDLHHVFIGAIAETFVLIPAGTATMNTSLATMFITLTGGILSIAIQLSAPILVAMLFTMAGLGLVARTVPQMNVFTMSFPVSFFLGMVLYIATLPFFPNWMQSHFLDQRTTLTAAIKSMVP